MLAAAGPRGVTRDRLIGILWPESYADRARHALSQTLYSLRRDVGTVVASTPDLRLQALIPSDVQELRDAVAGRRWADAAALYGGPFLDGFYLADAPEFERWVEGERASLAADGTRAIELAARESAAAGRHDEASALWQRLTRLDPFSARYAAACMESLGVVGDRAAALAHGRAYMDRMRRELGVEPDRAVQTLLDRLRDGDPTLAPAAAVSVASRPAVEPPPVPPISTIAAVAPLEAPAPPRARSRWWREAALLGGAGLLAAGWWSVHGTPRPAAAIVPTAPSRTADSLVARRFYDEGLRALYQFDAAAADRHFRAALREDPTSAMTAYRAWYAARTAGDADQETLAARALSLAPRASPRDSLLIATHVALARNDVAALATANALAARYPDDAEALVRAADAMPDLGRAVPLLDRAVRLDSAAADPRAGDACLSCEALSLLASRYGAADSIDAAERVARRWIRLRPADAPPWRFLAELLVLRGRRSEAVAAERRFESLGGARDDAAVRELVWDLQSDDLAAANARCDAGLAARDSATFVTFRWYCAIALRAQGRYRDALVLVREGRGPGALVSRPTLLPDPLLAPILDVEMGRPLLAIDAWRALADASDHTDAPPGVRARATSRGT
ncbi:transcriptional activator domain-containing protein [Gemmatirosa kalamazoonensis]|uniref:Transcriptional activator domain-containing protein n=1 Tax=Gemmatirosa kalamazoonensis TaxID=861299 RepID=W0RBI0_9BACT|nr:transcriptional activator domain-containing protein [Gemmatirosa kalamazoonensis]